MSHLQTPLKRSLDWPTGCESSHRTFSVNVHSPYRLSLEMRPACVENMAQPSKWSHALLSYANQTKLFTDNCHFPLVLPLSQDNSVLSRALWAWVRYMETLSCLDFKVLPLALPLAGSKGNVRRIQFSTISCWRVTVNRHRQNILSMNYTHPVCIIISH